MLIINVHKFLDVNCCYLSVFTVYIAFYNVWYMQDIIITKYRSTYFNNEIQLKYISAVRLNACLGGRRGTFLCGFIYPFCRCWFFCNVTFWLLFNTVLISVIFFGTNCIVWCKNANYMSTHTKLTHVPTLQRTTQSIQQLVIIPPWKLLIINHYFPAYELPATRVILENKQNNVYCLHT